MLKYDLYVVIGVVLAGLALPSIFGAMADRRSPRVALLTLIIAGVLIGLAVSQQPGVYDFEEVPHAFVRVIAHYTR